jgi:regulator of replication initiation timing
MTTINSIKADIKDLKAQETDLKAQAERIKTRRASLKLQLNNLRDALKDERQKAKDAKAAAPKAKRGRKPKAKTEAPKQEAPKTEAPKEKKNWDEIVARELASIYGMKLNMSAKEYTKIRWAYAKNNHPDLGGNEEKCKSANIIIDRMIDLAKQCNRTAA